jgi:prolyl oligopeptidase
MSLTDSRFAPVEELIHGVLVRDPYRWLEDRSLAETEAWIQEQQHRCDEYFGEMAETEYIHTRVTEYLDVDTIDQPARVGKLFFYRRRQKGQEQPYICVKDSESDVERVLINHSSLGQFVNVAIRGISWEGRRLAYDLRYGGADASEIRFVDTATGNILPDTIATGYSHGLVFALDGTGFFYCHEDASPTGDHLIRFHRFGDTAGDPVLYCSQRTRSSRLVLIGDESCLGAIYTHEGDSGLFTDLYLAEYGLEPEWRCIFANREAPDFPFLRTGRIFLYTEHGAANGQLLELNKDGSERCVVVPEGPTRIEQTSFVNSRVYVSYCVDRATEVHSWPTREQLTGISMGDPANLPTNGTIRLLQNMGPCPSSFFYSYESFAEPLRIFEYFPATRTTTSISSTTTLARNDGYQLRTVFYRSRDGATIPLSLLAQSRDPKRNDTPVILSGYGGFGASFTPGFTVLAAMMLELGATLAFPNIRGGGESGHKWHEAARGRNRQVAIDDYVAAAEWLVEEGLTVPSRIGLLGGSNAGLLVGSAITQHPDLFRAVVCIAPMLDMVRYERFDRAAKWQREYGSAGILQDFQALYSYSPYHQVREGTNYPATLFVSGDSDDRCNPAHVRKMTARLQGLNSQTNSIVVDYSKERGHVPTLPLSVRIDALTRRIAFLCRELHIEVRKEDTDALARA